MTRFELASPAAADLTLELTARNFPGRVVDGFRRSFGGRELAQRTLSEKLFEPAEP
jgi:hypothetical protein